MTVDRDDRAVDHRVFHIRLARDRIEYPFENIGVDPVPKPLEDGVPVAERLRKIAPRAVGPSDPQHCLHKQTTVATGPSRVTRLTQAMRLDPRPLGIRQTKTYHRSDPQKELESDSNHFGNPESQQALVD
jgi:hypothetical protein